MNHTLTVRGCRPDATDPKLENGLMWFDDKWAPSAYNVS